MNKESFKLGDYLVIPSKSQIVLNGVETTIEPKAMAVLCVLKDRSGEVISQQDLFNHVWKDRIFSPSSLQRVIALLRKALGESSQSPQFLFTHPKLGYRLEGVSPLKSKPHYFPKNIILLSVLTLLLVCVTAMWFVANKTVRTPSMPSELIQLSHTDKREVQPKFSENELYISYLELGETKHLVIINNKTHEVIKRLPLPASTTSYIWYENDILTLNKEQSEGISIQRYTNFLNAQLRTITITQFRSLASASNLLMHEGKLFFIAKQQTFNLYAFDILTNNLHTITALANELISASITSSPNAVYVHYYDGNKPKLAEIRQNQVAYWDEHVLPDIASIVWSDKYKGVLLSDHLNPKQYLLKHNELSPLILSEQQTLQHIKVQDDSLLAIIGNQDMDIFTWRDNEAISTIDSKFADYLVKVGNKEQIAYLSNRHGFPQLYLKQGDSESILYKNNEQSQFIAPFTWSPDKTKLAAAITGKLILFEPNIQQQRTIQLPFDVQRVFSWTEQNTLLIQTERGVKEYSLDTLAASTLNDSGNIIYLNRTQSGQLFGVTNEYAFWQNKRLALGNKHITFAFSINDQLITQIHLKDKKWLVIYNKQGEIITKLALPNECDVVTDGKQRNEQEYEWYCTRYTSNDTDVYRLAL